MQMLFKITLDSCAVLLMRLKPFWLKTIPRIGVNSLGDLMTFAHMGLKIRGMGKKDLREFMRIATLPARDLMDEFFDDDLLKATFELGRSSSARKKHHDHQMAPCWHCCIAWPRSPTVPT